ncbi:MAG: DUF1838 family protein [Bacteroidetes bacterium]|nr:DUF1838 family protein [Bacteroidota bacterium]
MNHLIACFCSFLLFNNAIWAQNKSSYNLENARDNMDAYMKVRGSLSPADEVVFYAKGSIYAYDPEKPWKHLFNFEMFNIARSERLPGDSGWKLITREMLVYQDPKTNEILSSWKNPWTKEEVEVMHVWNDPVNQQFRYGAFKVPYQRMGNDRLGIFNDVPLSYPSPLTKNEWPEHSRSDVYQGAELFNFFCSEKELNNKKIVNATADVSWTRFSDFLPWMKMSSLPGNLLYQGRGYKLKNGYADLPAVIKTFVENNFPEYAHAPATYTTPNMTSWRYFKKVMEERKRR